MPEIVLGDIIDDHCSRCRRLTDHSVVALVGDSIKKVRCRTCQFEHGYRHGKGGARTKTKKTAFDEVLASITAQFPGQSIPEEKPKRAPRRQPREPR